MTKQYIPRAQAPKPAPGQRIGARWVSKNSSWSFYGLDINEAAYLREHFQAVQAAIDNDPRPRPNVRDVPAECLQGIRESYMGMETYGAEPRARAAVAALLPILSTVMLKNERKFDD